MSQPIQVLIIEDNPADAELVLRHLRCEGFEPAWQRVETEKDFLEKLHSKFDIIISDFEMPQFNGLRALELLNERAYDIPFIIVSGAIGEENVVTAIKNGATDFLLKDRLGRLGMAVSRALHEARERAARKEVHNQLLWKTAFFDAAVNSSIDGILIVDNDGKMILQNQRMVELWNFPDDLITGREDERWLAWVTSQVKNPRQFAERVAYLYTHPDEVSRDELELVDGRYFDRYSAPVRNQHGQHHGRIWSFRDITENKRADEKRQELVSLIEQSHDFIATADFNGRLTSVNAGARAMIGIKADQDLSQLHLTDYVPEEWQAFFRDTVLPTAFGNGIWEGEMQLSHLQTGALIDVFGTVFVIRDSAGNPKSFATVTRDITKQKRAMDALWEREEQLRLYAEDSPVAVAMFDREMKYLVASRRWTEDFRLEDEPLIGRSHHEVFPEMPQRWKDIHRRCLAGAVEKCDEEAFVRSDGRTDWLRWEVRPWRQANGTIGGIIIFSESITERKRAAQQIGEQAALLDQARDAIAVAELDTTVLYWNQGAELMYGWTREEAVGRKLTELFALAPRWVTTVNSKLLEHGELADEAERVTKDGRKLIVEARRTLIRDEGGNPKSIFAIYTDVTEKKRIEAQFMRSQRMESIGTLAGGIAHDLNNILGPILMSIEILKGEFSSPKTAEILETIQACATRGADIVRQVLSFARGIEGERVEIQIKHLLGDLKKIINDTFPKNIRLKFAVSNDCWTISGDPTQVHQILLNLCVNARDAMPDGGALTVTVKNSVIDEQYASMNVEAKAGQYVQICVADTGTGITSELLDKIFDPFFTTKGLNKGTGLGLSTVSGIVRSHGGFITVKSKVGIGTSFHVYLPAIEFCAEQQKAQLTQANLPRGRGETVLVVDDEMPLLVITCRTLENFGYRTLKASDGAEAMAIYAEQMNEIDIVLTDLMMPVMDGRALVRGLRRIRPEVKIIASSGLFSEGGEAPATLDGVKQFLTKPYSTAALLTALQEALHEQGASRR